MGTDKVTKKIRNDMEKGARRALLEELFNDVYASRSLVYRMNFVRGIFFGLGSVLGGTIVVTLVVWGLNLFTDIPGGIGDFVQQIVDSMQPTR